MANELSTAGVLLKYAVETTAGTKPAAFTTLPGAVEIPDMNEAPAQLDCTDLSDTTYRRYIPGLKDTGGALAFRFNLTTAFETAWNALVTAAGTAKESNKSTWFEVYVPGFKSFFFTGEPTPLGMSGFGVDEVLQVDAYITANSVSGWAASST